MARLLAIDRGVDHSLSSPMPYLGIVAEESVLRLLDGRPVRQSVTSTRPGVKSRLGLLNDIDPATILGRLDGVALLAEALNSSAPLGRYMHLIRLFERAFGLPAAKLVQPLTDLLRASQFGFEESEVRDWMSARPLSAHADRRKRFFLDADLRSLVRRMLFAGYEVLLNKAAWREPGADRREVWKPSAGTTAGGHGLFTHQGSEATFVIEILDGFDAYPLLLAGPCHAALPRGAWLVGDPEAERLEVGGTWESGREAPVDRTSTHRTSAQVRDNVDSPSSSAINGEGG
jgi:hypothetical protein